MAEPTTAGQDSAQSDELKESQLAKRLVTNLFVLLRTTYIHDQKNDALLPPLKNIESTVRDIIEFFGGSSFILRVVGSTFFINSTLIKLDQTSFQTAEFVQIICEELGIGELEFADGAAESDFRALSQSIVGAVRTGLTLETGLQKNLGRIVLKPPVEMGGSRTLLDKRQYVLRTYGLTLMFCNEMLEKWSAGKLPRLNEVKRYSQALLDLIDEDGATLLGLTQLKAYRKFIAHHFVNVAIISQVIGVSAGLGKKQLVNLGMTGLLHEVGTIDLPTEMVERIDSLSESEENYLTRLPLITIGRLLEFEGYTAAGMARLVAIFENKGHINRPINYKNDWEPTVDAEILAVADAYDNLTTSRLGSRALRPDQALEVLMINRSKKFAEWAVKALAKGIGRYPIGVMVELNTGERGVVIDLPQSSSPADRPKIRLISGADGSQISGGVMLDLSDINIPDIASRSIARTLDPEAESVNVVQFFLD